MSLGKETKIAERLKFVFAFDFFNIFNHPNFYDPFPNLEDPADFGAITTQIVPNPNGFPLVQTFYRPRAIQVSTDSVLTFKPRQEAARSKLAAPAEQ